MALEFYHPGLEGVIAGETNISCVEGEFVYRGYPVSDLADGARFLEVAHLLLMEELPTQEQLADFRSLLWDDAELPEAVAATIRQLPLHAGPIEALRTGVSLLGNFDPQLHDPVLQCGVSQAIRLMARLPLLIGEWRHACEGSPLCGLDPTSSYAAYVLSQLTGKEPTLTEERAFEASLVLFADFGFTAPTYAARLASSTGANVYSSVTAALAAMANTGLAQRFGAILDVLAAVSEPDHAERWVRYRVGESLPLPGYQDEQASEPDPRAPLLQKYCAEMAGDHHQIHLEEVADAIDQAVWQATSRFPHVEWPAARLYTNLGIGRDLHGVAMICGCLPGWCAHILEQAESEEEIRPRARYRGAEGQRFESLAIRG